MLAVAEWHYTVARDADPLRCTYQTGIALDVVHEWRLASEHYRGYQAGLAEGRRQAAGLLDEVADTLVAIANGEADCDACDSGNALDNDEYCDECDNMYMRELDDDDVSELAAHELARVMAWLKPGVIEEDDNG